MVAITKKTIFWSFSTMGGLILLFAFLGPLVPRKEVKNWICPVSGSTRTQITWFGNFRHEDRTVTALEKWLGRREADFKPSWQHLSTQTYFLWGKSCATGGTPEIYHLKPILDRVVDRWSDEQITHLVSVLRYGSRDEQKAMTRKITDEIFD